MKTLFYGDKMDICCRCTLEFRLLGISNVYQQNMLLESRKPILKYTLNKFTEGKCLAVNFEDSQLRRNMTFNFIVSKIYVEYEFDDINILTFHIM